NARYPGTSGNTHGEANETSPAASASAGAHQVFSCDCTSASIEPYHPSHPRAPGSAGPAPGSCTRSGVIRPSTALQGSPDGYNPPHRLSTGVDPMKLVPESVQKRYETVLRE